MPYLVDGNNLAHAMGLASGGLADREACARTVASFCRTRGARAILVFDGGASESGSNPKSSGPVSVRYSGSRPADEVILRLVADSKTPRDFIVVTSDKSLGDKARHRGASVQRAHEFSRRLEPRQGSQPQEGLKASRGETPEEIDAWLAVFDPGRK
jgi:predicted RNA-binding protein with PIN domain